MAYKKYLTFSYDDGVQQDKRLLALFKQYGLKGTFNLNAKLMPETVTPGARCVALEEVAALYAGQEVATHGSKHGHFGSMAAEDVRREIEEDKEILSALVGYPVLGHAYPYGEYNDTVVDVLRDCGIRYARTVISTGRFALPAEPLVLPATCHHANGHIFELIDAFLAAEPVEGDLLFYIWGHSYELDQGIAHNSWDYMEEICRRLGGHDDIAYVTNMEFFDRNK